MVYKNGQGYWTRVLSAIWFGLIAGLAVWWVWLQVESIGSVQTSNFKWLIMGSVLGAGAVLFGGVLYYFIGMRAKTVDFLINADAEMKKVNWPSRREAIGSTWVVIVCTFLCVLLLFVADLIFSTLFSAIKVLDESPWGFFN